MYLLGLSWKMKKRKRKVGPADVAIFLGSLLAPLVILLSLLLFTAISFVSPQTPPLATYSSGATNNKLQQISTNTTSGVASKMAHLGGSKLLLSRPQPPYSSSQLLLNQAQDNIQQLIKQPKSTCKNHSSQHHNTIRILRHSYNQPVQIPQAEPDFGHPSSTRSNFHLFYQPIIDPIRPTQFTHPNNLSQSPAAFPIDTVQVFRPVNNSQQQQQLVDQQEEVLHHINGSLSETPCQQSQNVSYVEYSHQTFDTDENEKNRIASNKWSVERVEQPNNKHVIESQMMTNKSQVSLICNAHDMLVRFKFREPFRGLVISDLSRLRSCHLVGSGALYYEMRLPLNDCGTRQGNPRLFLNNIQIQFRNFLHAEEDEIKTLICSYPTIQPPILIRPSITTTSGSGMLKPNSVLPERIIEDTTGGRDKEAPASLIYYEPTIILIASLLLIAITLLGLTTSAYLLVKRRKRTDRIPTPTSSRFSPNHEATFGYNLQLAQPPLISLTRGADIQMMPSPPKLRRAKNYRLKRKPELSEKHQHKYVSKQSSDSLAANLNENSSITTIEIPFIAPVERWSKNGEPEQSLDKPKDDNEKVTKRKKEIARAKKVDRQEETGQVNKEVQVDSGTAPFGSLRASLTSPQEFKRLQEIVRIFDEIHIENRIERGSKKTPLVYNTTRLNPSKYKNRILDIMSKDERELISELLSGDELFRSQVVESTNLERFNRKLRNNLLYSNLISQEAWNLFAEILLDLELDKENENNDQEGDSMVAQLDTSTGHVFSSSLSSITRKDSLDSDIKQTTFNSDSRVSIGKELHVSMKELIKM